MILRVMGQSLRMYRPYSNITPWRFSQDYFREVTRADLEFLLPAQSLADDPALKVPVPGQPYDRLPDVPSSRALEDAALKAANATAEQLALEVRGRLNIV